MLIASLYSFSEWLLNPNKNEHSIEMKSIALISVSYKRSRTYRKTSKTGLKRGYSCAILKVRKELTESYYPDQVAMEIPT